jgi:hypothetical protein
MRSEEEIREAIEKLTEQKNNHSAKSTDANEEGLAALHNELASEADCKLEALEWVIGDSEEIL